MGGVARLARNRGIGVSGSDANTYPPMSTQLEQLDVELFEGYRPGNVPGTADTVIVGNAISRGNPELEEVLDRGLPYTSGAQWLAENILRDQWVLAVAGTHGKTTTAGLLAWILEDNGLDPGFLIGGVPDNFGVSARSGNSRFFVIEADEYDTAFFDKRSKFIHYRPTTCVLNNLEFDHADIFDSIEDIKRQFSHLLRVVPAGGRVIVNRDSTELQDVIASGCWSDIEYFDAANSAGTGPVSWTARPEIEDCSGFTVVHEPGNGKAAETVKANWNLIGRHNMANGLAAIAAACHVGINLERACTSLASFMSVKRCLEHIGSFDGLDVYDDFAITRQKLSRPSPPSEAVSAAIASWRCLNPAQTP